MSSASPATRAATTSSPASPAGPRSTVSRGEIRNDEDIQARIDHDLYYVDNWSLWLDVKIVLATAFGLFGDKNAY